MAERRAVVITGVGAVSAAGIGADALWGAALTGKSAVRPIRRFDAALNRCRVAGEIRNFTPSDYIEPRIIKQTDRSTHLALAACHLASKDAGLDRVKINAADLGMYVANTFGGMEFAEPELYAQSYLAPGRVSAYQAIAWFYAATQGQWTIGQRITGYAKSIVGDRAGSLQAILLGALAIRQGHCTGVLAGGFEAPLSPYVYAIHEATGYLSNDDIGYRPFDCRAGGMVIGEGAGILLLEARESAERRNAPIYAELAGGAMNIDLPNLLDDEDTQLAACLTSALADAGMEPEQVGHVLPEGCAVRAWDAREAIAIRRAFGEHAANLTASVPKAVTGHTLGAAGSLDVVLASRMLRDRVRLGGAPERPVTPSSLNFLGEPAPFEAEAVVCMASGWHGLNSALVLRRALH